ncbi:Tir chaperone protein (CesT) [Caballeronia calidae]|uniref:Tir chaperone protein (CesT) n=1 Tax=Caballeronia calidae TaxID=1777139 RepID=A0A158EMH2_9BURK|nr:CesT family type III secretion system chaperone [Caballeronia calidae]SAL07127.1 Tir chaperone protein (CesT) [Caballeronia calidae]
MQEWHKALLTDFCEVVDIPASDQVLSGGSIDVDGFSVDFLDLEDDESALYVNFHYGIVTAGRTYTVFRLLLEANLLVYAKDDARLGLDPSTGGVILFLRFSEDAGLDGEQLSDILSHYADHARYWRTQIFEASDEMYEGVARGDYTWLQV